MSTEELDLLNGIDVNPSEDQEGGVPPDPTPAPTGSVGDQEEASMTNPHEWSKSLGDDLRKEVSLHKFKDVSSLAKSYIELEKARGRGPFPGPKATEEEIQAFYRKAGIPEAKDYTLDAKEFGLEDKIAEELKEIASKNGIPPHGMKATLQFLQEKHGLMAEDAMALQKEYVANGVAALQKEYGSAFDKYKKLATEAVKEIYSPEEIGMLKERGLASDPLFVKVLMDRARSMYGEEIIEDKHTKSGFVATPAAIEARITEIFSDPDYMDSTRPRHESLVKEVEKLFAAKNSI